MHIGNWVPIDKSLVKHLPKERPYSRIEAAFSLQLDYDSSNTVTVSGYSAQWHWSRKKVRNFLKDMGITIDYPKRTSEIQNQRGQIRIQIGDRSDKKKGQIRDRTGATTSNPNTNKLNNPGITGLNNTSLAPKNLEELFKPIKAACEQIEKLSAKDDRSFSVYHWVQNQINNKRHQGAILEALRGVIDYWQTIEDPWGYANSIMKTKNQNYNEKENIRESNNFKEILKSLVPKNN